MVHDIHQGTSIEFSSTSPVSCSAACISAFLRRPSALFLSLLVFASSHSPTPAVDSGLMASFKARRNLSILAVFSRKRSFPICASCVRYSAVTRQSRRLPCCTPMRDSKPRPIDLMPTIGVVSDVLDVAGMMLRAPDSRKPAVSAQRRTSWACCGVAVYMCNI